MTQTGKSLLVSSFTTWWNSSFGSLGWVGTHSVYDGLLQLVLCCICTCLGSYFIVLAGVDSWFLAWAFLTSIHISIFLAAGGWTEADFGRLWPPGSPTVGCGPHSCRPRDQSATCWWPLVARESVYSANCWQVVAGSCKLKLVPVSNRILKLVLYFTGSRCNKLRMSEIWSCNHAPFSSLFCSIQNLTDYINPN